MLWPMRVDKALRIGKRSQLFCCIVLSLQYKSNTRWPTQQTQRGCSIAANLCVKSHLFDLVKSSRVGLYFGFVIDGLILHGQDLKLTKLTTASALWSFSKRKAPIRSFSAEAPKDFPGNPQYLLFIKATAEGQSITCKDIRCCLMSTNNPPTAILSASIL